MLPVCDRLGKIWGNTVFLLNFFKILIILVKKCVVALQLENGERLVHEFNSDNTLFNILMHWNSQSERYTVC
jgi:hypothetical protein